MIHIKMSLSGQVHLLDEDLAEARLAARVVLQVELVEAMENVLVGMHVEGVHIQVVPVGARKKGRNRNPGLYFKKKLA